jgi:DNA-directed RNA polymerase alpha subunit
VQLRGDFETKLVGERTQPEPVTVAQIDEHQEKPQENTLNLLQLPSRVHNALERVGITTVDQVLELTHEHRQDVTGLGEKAVDDINKSRERYLKRHTSSKDDNEAQT